MEQFLAKTPNPLLSVTKDGVLNYANDAAAPLLHEWGIRVGKSLPSNVTDLIKSVISQNSPEKLEVKAENRVYLLVISPLLENECVNISGFDISAQKELEEKLLENEEKYRIIADNTYDWEFWVDPDGRLIYISPSCKRVTGYTAQEFIDNPELLKEIIHPDDWQTFLPHKQDTSPWLHGDIEFRIITKDGRIKWIHRLCQSVYDAKSRYAGKRGSIREITERKRMEDSLKNAQDDLKIKVKERTAELEQAYNLLKESEKGLANAQKIAHIGSWDWNLATGEVYWSKELYCIFGHPPQKTGTTFDEFLSYVHPDDRDYVNNSMKKGLIGEPITGDYRIVLANGEERIVHTEAEVLYNEENNPIQVKGIVQDITERKKVENELKEGEGRLKALFKLLPVGVSITDKERYITDANFALENILGLSRSDLLNGKQTNRKYLKSDGTEMLPEEFPSIKALREKGSIQNSEIGIIKEDGNIIWTDVSATALPFCNEEVVIVTRDITESKQAEEEKNQLLQNIDEQRAYLQAIIDSLPVGLWIADATGRLIFTNNVASKIWGGKIPSSKSIDEYNTYKAWWPETGESIAAKDMPLARAIQGETHSERVVDFERFDGTHGTQLVSSAPIKTPNGTILGGLAIVQDITELKCIEKELQMAYEEVQAQSEDLAAQTEELRRANEALNESKNRFKLLSEATALLLSSNDPEAIIQTISENVMRHLNCDIFFNYLYNEGTGRFHLNAYSGISPEAAKEIEWLDKMDEKIICDCVARNGCRLAAENLMHEREKQTDPLRPMLIQAYACQPLHIREKTLGAISFGTKSRNTFTEDELSFISYVADQVSVAIERKQAEEKIRDLANIIESSNDAIATRSLDGIITSWNKGAEHIYGYSAEEILGKNVNSLIPPAFNDETEALIETIKKGEKVQHYETLRLRKDGAIINVALSFSPVFDMFGKLIAISVIARDITEHKRVERAFKLSEERYRIIAEQTGQIVYDYDAEKNDVCWAGNIKEFTGYDPDIFRNMTLSRKSRVHPEDLDKLQDKINRYMKHGGSYHSEYRLKKSNGSYIFVEDNGVCLKNEMGKINRVLGAIKDITERKLSQERLEMSERKYRSFVENFKGIVYQADENFIPQFLHGAVKEITGYSEEEFMAELPWKKIVEPEYLPIIHDDEIKLRASTDICTIEREFKIKNRKGKTKWVHETCQKIPGENGKIIYQGVIYDITGRKQVEETLAKYEIARKKEIHHRIKNNLQIISALLDLQAEELKGRTDISNSELFHAFKESQDRVFSMALIHEELYRGGGTDKLNFSSYIEKLAENLILTYRVGNKDISLDMDLEENTFFDTDTAIPLGLIINELVSNSFKYAFHGRSKGEISIGLFRDKNRDSKNKGSMSKAYILSVSDNGVGIPENIDIENLDSLGLQLVTSLVDQLDGKLGIIRSNGTETTVKFTVTEEYNRE